MNVKKEVYEKCKRMIEGELSYARYELLKERFDLSLAKKQRILKAQIGKLYEILKTFKS